MWGAKGDTLAPFLFILLFEWIISCKSMSQLPVIVLLVYYSYCFTGGESQTFCFLSSCTFELPSGKISGALEMQLLYIYIYMCVCVCVCVCV